MDKKEKNEYFKNMRNAFDIKSEKWFAREDGIKVGLAEGEARGLAKGREEGLSKGHANGSSQPQGPWDKSRANCAGHRTVD